MVELFSISSNVVSLAKESTSYHLLLSLSVTEIISITFELDNFICVYFSAVEKEKYSVTISPLSAFTFFFNKNFVGVLLSDSKIVTSRGSYELENLKLQSSNVLNVVPILGDLTSAPALTFNAYLKSGFSFKAGTV